VDKAVEFGLAANGISGIETALGLVLAAVDAGRLSLRRAIAAMTTGPAGIIGLRTRRGATRGGLTEGLPAELVVIDRSATWTVTAASLRSKGKNSPLLGMTLPGRVLLTMAAGEIAYEAPPTD
jgi:dihydroorotase